MTRIQNSQTWDQPHRAPDRLTSILGIVIGLLTALATNVLLH